MLWHSPENTSLGFESFPRVDVHQTLRCTRTCSHRRTVQVVYHRSQRPYAQSIKYYNSYGKRPRNPRKQLTRLASVARKMFTRCKRYIAMLSRLYAESIHTRFRRRSTDSLGGLIHMTHLRG